MRYDLADFEWSVIEAVLPKGKSNPQRKDDRRVMNGIFWVLGGALWRAIYPTDTAAVHNGLQSLQPMAQCWRLGSIDGHGHEGVRWQTSDDRQFDRTGSPAQQAQKWGRSLRGS